MFKPITFTPWKGMVALSVPIFLISNPAISQEEAEAPAETATLDEGAMNALGFAMGSQLGLMIGFSDEELDAIFEGMRMAVAEDEPADFQAGIQRAQSIYMSKRSAYEAEQAAKRAELAEANKAEGIAYLAEIEKKEGVVKTESGLLYEILEEGEGDKPGKSDTVTVNYVGTLIDGTEFDAGENASFPVNRVVPGFGEGLQLANVGSKIKLYIPSDLGYGDAPQRPGSQIEPGDALIFEVEILDIKKAPSGPKLRTPPSGPPPGPPPQLPKDLKPPPPPPSSPPPPPPSRN